MSWKQPYKPVLEIGADWLFRALIGVCVAIVWDIRTDLKTLEHTVAADNKTVEKEIADIKTQAELNRANVFRLRYELDQIQASKK